MRSILRIPATLVLGLACTSCSSMSVTADHDVSVDFPTFQSFSLFERNGSEKRRPQMSELVDRRIASAISSEIGTKGLEAVEPRRADLLVTFYTSVRKRVVVSHAGWYGSGRWGRWGMRGGARRVHSFAEGSLIIDIVERRSRELVWRGVGEGAFTKMNPSEEQVAKRVAKILRDFPPDE